MRINIKKKIGQQSLSNFILSPARFFCHTAFSLFLLYIFLTYLWSFLSIHIASNISICFQDIWIRNQSHKFLRLRCGFLIRYRFCACIGAFDSRLLIFVCVPCFAFTINSTSLIWQRIYIYIISIIHIKFYIYDFPIYITNIAVRLSKQQQQ